MKNTNDIKGIIFDLDGVLLSTDHFHYLAWKSLADKLEIPFDETVNEKLRGVSRMASFEIILSNKPELKLTEAEKEAYAAEKNELYRTYLQTMTPADVSDDVRATLKALRERGYLLAVGSSSKNAGFILERTEMREYFDAVSDGNNITNSKPDPEVFLKAAEYIGLAPEVCAVVEDAEAGLEGAVAGKMLPVAIGSAHGSPLAQISLDTFADLAVHFAG
ncbi:MAG: beta-phosphoglucomutase [Clostridia bacterium]|nr:beta-phosphoglucomutase [Clostridia bacterium]